MRLLWFSLCTVVLIAACDSTKTADPTKGTNAPTTKVEPKNSASEVAADKGNLKNADAAKDTQVAQEAKAETPEAPVADTPSLPEWAKDIDLATVDVTAEVARVKKVMDDEREAFMTAYNAANKAEKLQMRDKFPKPETYTAHINRLIEVRSNANDLGAAYAFIASRTRGEDADKAMKLLFEKYSDSPALVELYQPLVFGLPGEETESRLKLMMNSSHKDVAGAGTLGMAEYLTNLNSMKESVKENPGRVPNEEYVKTREIGEEETAELFRKVVNDYASVAIGTSTAGEKAESALFELDNLRVGKTAPDIEAEDIEGVAFKLSEYRGKVVLLDFWGDW